MMALSKMILVNAPVDLIWSYVENPLQVAAMSDGLNDVRDIQPAEKGGYDCTFVYSLGGVSVEMTLQTTEYVRNRRLVTRVSGWINSVQTWTFEPAGRATTVNFDINYDADPAAPDRWAERLAAGSAKQEIDRILLRLKDICEALAAQRPTDAP